MTSWRFPRPRSWWTRAATWPSPTAGPASCSTSSPEDLARPFQDLEVSSRPLELRSRIQQVYVERRPSRVYEVGWPAPSGEIAHLEVRIAPLVDENRVLLGASIGFADVTRPRRDKEELEHANQGLAEPQEGQPVAE